MGWLIIFVIFCSQHYSIPSVYPGIQQHLATRIFENLHDSTKTGDTSSWKNYGLWTIPWFIGRSNPSTYKQQMCILIAVVSYRISDYQVQLEAAGVIFLGHPPAGIHGWSSPKICRTVGLTALPSYTSYVSIFPRICLKCYYSVLFFGLSFPTFMTMVEPSWITRIKILATSLIDHSKPSSAASSPGAFSRSTSTKQLAKGPTNSVGMP